MSGLRSGVCSVTFRHRPADDVIDLARQAGVAAIEWGADVHAPPGDLGEASRLRERCASFDIACPSYGSYVAVSQTSPDELDLVVSTAVALGASTVRVWTPYGVPPGADPAVVESITAATRDACDRLATSDLTLALEFHPDTLTETSESALSLISKVDRPNLRTYWQPRWGAEPDAAMSELRAVLPVLCHLHVFSWKADGRRLPLEAHAELWRRVLAAVDDAPPAERFAYLEFVADDDPTAFARDADTLHSWLEACG
jgi:sugar phosphate isomerase/epimerase